MAKETVPVMEIKAKIFPDGNFEVNANGNAIDLPKLFLEIQKAINEIKDNR